MSSLTPREINTLITKYELGRRGFILRYSKYRLTTLIYDITTIDVDIEADEYKGKSMSKILTKILKEGTDEQVSNLVTELDAEYDSLKYNRL